MSIPATLPTAEICRKLIAGTALLALLLLPPLAPLQAAEGRQQQKLLVKPASIPALPANLNGGWIGTSGGTLLALGGAGAGNADQHPLTVYTLPAGASAWQPSTITAPAFSAAARWDKGWICVGGSVNGRASNAVTQLDCDDRGTVRASPLPPLPQPIFGAGAAVIGSTLYVFGGASADAPAALSNAFWSLDLSKPTDGWRAVTPLPGAGRAFAAVTAQYGMVGVFGGVVAERDGTLRNTSEAWVYRPTPLEGTDRSGWRRMQDAPAPFSHAVAEPLGQAKALIAGGEQNPPPSLFASSPASASAPPRLFHAITNAWCAFDQPLGVSPVRVVRFGEALYAFGGKPDAAGTTGAVQLEMPRTVRNLSWIDYVVILAYFVFISLIGVYFSRKQESSEEFSLGSRKIAWWAAGISMFATGASAISFMAIPALTFATNLVFLFPVVLLVPAYFINAHLIFPVLRRMNITSTYEYLERRFNRPLRLIASVQCMALQTFGRASIVLVLPALAISAVTGINVFASVIVMGVLTTIYTALGGFEAVIWTEVFQGMLKFIAPIVMIIFCITSLPGGLREFWDVGVANHKFDFALPTLDVTVPAVWVLTISFLFQFTISKAGDQPIIQRVFSSPVAEVRRVTAMDCACGILIGTLVNVLGLSIYCYFRAHPAQFDPTATNDQIVPLFTVQAMPTGIAGMIVAAIFASAMATVASSMNSVATIFTEDFYLKLRPDATDRQRLKTLKTGSYLVGAIATAIALYLATRNIASILVVWNQVSALLGGGIVAVYSLGMFTKRSNGFGAVCGALISVVITLAVKLFTPLHWATYLPIAILSCMAFGYIFSLLGEQNKNLDGLTVYTPANAP